MRSAAVVLGLLALGICETPAFSQAMVESAGASGAASGSAGALKALGDTIKGTMGGVDGALKPSSTTTVVHTSEPAVAKPGKSKTGAMAAAVPKPVYEDPQQIQAGISYEDLMHRFGPPAMRWTEDSGETKLTYMTKAGPVQLDFAKDGKVSSVEKPKL